MSRRVRFTRDAREDLRRLNTFLHRREGAARAREIIGRLRTRCATLAEMAERGNVPPEIDAASKPGHRELHMPPYRIFYVVGENEVFVVAVFDGRQDIETALGRRPTRGE